MIVLRWAIILKSLQVYFGKFEAKWDWALTPQYFKKMSDYNTNCFIFTIFLSLHVTRHDDWTDQIPILILHDHFVAVYCQIQLAP